MPPPAAAPFTRRYDRLRQPPEFEDQIGVFLLHTDQKGRGIPEQFGGLFVHPFVHEIGARAETAARPGQYHHPDLLIRTEMFVQPMDFFQHFQIDGVEFLGTVQSQQANPWFDFFEPNGFEFHKPTLLFG